MTKEELIDYTVWITKQSNKTLGLPTNELVDLYLKSINSTSNEALTLGNNEQKKKHNICDIPNCGKIAPKNDIFCKDHR